MRVTSILASLVLAASPALAIDFPLRGNDLAPGERVVTATHAPGGGPQTNAKDLRILRWDSNGKSWSNLKANATKINGQPDLTVNSNYLVYNRPVYAMAGGTVVACWRNAPQNSGNIQRSEVLGTRKIYLQGNHLWIQQADGNIALYAHAITGDIPAALCPHNDVFLTGTAKSGPVVNEPEAAVTNGATVTAGQLLFRAGNSGNSSEPHLHVHLVNSSNTTRVMNFDRGMTTPFGGSTTLAGPWTRLLGTALPAGNILVWPPHPIGNWTYNGIEGSAYQRVFDHFVDSGMMLDTVTCTNNGASYNTTWIPAKGSWVSHHGMTAADYVAKNLTYTKQGYKQTAVFTCGSVRAAIWRKP